MRISNKDWIFLAVVAAVVIIFFAISGKEKTKTVPVDAAHAPSYELFKRTQSKMEVDKGCPACHYDQGGIPFPPNHPVKPKGGPMRCLFCHKLRLSGLK